MYRAAGIAASAMADCDFPPPCLHTLPFFFFSTPHAHSQGPDHASSLSAHDMLEKVRRALAEGGGKGVLSLA